MLWLELAESNVIFYVIVNSFWALTQAITLKFKKLK